MVFASVGSDNNTRKLRMERVSTALKIQAKPWPDFEGRGLRGAPLP
jgi:hypothetical protein